MTLKAWIFALLHICGVIQFIQCYPGSKRAFSPVLLTLKKMAGPAPTASYDDQGVSEDDSSRHLVPINQDTVAEDMSDPPASDNLDSQVKDQPDSDSLDPQVKDQPASDSLDPQVKDQSDSDNLDSQVKDQPNADSLDPQVKSPPDSDNSDSQVIDLPGSDNSDPLIAEKPDSDSPGPEVKVQSGSDSPHTEVKDQSGSDNSDPQIKDQPGSDSPGSEVKDQSGSDNSDPQIKDQPDSGSPGPEVKVQTGSDDSDPQIKDQPDSGSPGPEVKVQSGSDSPNTEVEDQPGSSNPKLNKEKNCWIGLEAKNHFDTMSKIEAEYEESRTAYQKQVGGNTFDIEMLEVMLKKRGMAERAVEAADGNPAAVPAGISLGGYCMLRMKNSILFFHRLKLRNNTHFRINFLKNDLYNMLLTGRISLNDIHLAGSYERALTDTNPANLFYSPSNGFADFLLKGVEYKVEGRYRVIEDRLKVEMIISELAVKEALVVFKDKKQQESTPVAIDASSLEDFLDKLKIDLNEWVKDYFNDFLLFSKQSIAKDKNIKLFDKQKTQALNNYMERVIKLLKQRQQTLKLNSLKLPDFTLNAQHGLKLKLTDGVLRGVDSMYRRSVATGYLEPHSSGKGPRRVDATIGFSNLKVIYKYKAQASPTAPELGGLFYLSSNELAAHLGLTLVKEPETADLLIDQIQAMKPESLTVEGPANQMIVVYRHLLEQHILAMMTNTLSFTIKSLASLTKCEPDLRGYVEPGDEHSGHIEPENESITPRVSGINYDTAGETQSEFEKYSRPKIISDHEQDKNKNIFVVKENESMELKVPDQKGDDKVLHVQKIVKNVIKERPEGGKQEGDSTTSEEKDTNADFVVKDTESIELQVPNQKGKTKNVHVHQIEKYLVSVRPGAGVDELNDDPGDGKQSTIESDGMPETNKQSTIESDGMPETNSDPEQDEKEQSLEYPDQVPSKDSNSKQDETKNKFIVKENESMELKVPDEKGNQKQLHVKKIIKKVIQERPAGGNNQLHTNDAQSSEDNDADFIVKDIESLEVRVPNHLGENKNVHVHQLEKYLVSVHPDYLGHKLKSESDLDTLSNIQPSDDVSPESDYRPKTNSDLEKDQNKYIVKENESIELNVPDQHGNEKNLHVQKIVENVIKEKAEGDKTEENTALYNEKADFVVKDTESIELSVPNAKGIDKNVHVHKVENYLVNERPSPGADKTSESETGQNSPDRSGGDDDVYSGALEKQNEPAEYQQTEGNLMDVSVTPSGDEPSRKTLSSLRTFDPDDNNNKVKIRTAVN